MAVGLVIAYHAKAPIITGGFVGVDVFFVISGFVITGLLLRERTQTGRTSLLGFWARRARRILPAATVVLIATVLATYHFQGFLRGNEVAVDGRWTAIFLANFHAAWVGTSYFGAQGTESPLLHYWSLAVEEQFYLVFPLLFAGTAGLMIARRRHGGLVAMLAVVITGSLALSIVQTTSSPIVAFFSPFTRSWELAFGGLIALSAPFLRRVPSSVAAVATWVGLGGVGLAAVYLTAATPYPGTAVILPVAATGLVIAGGLVAPRFGAELMLGSWLGLRGGEISYALYLWHFPLLVFAAQQSDHPLRWTERAALIGIALVLAVITRTLIENPIRHWRSLARRPGLSVGLGAVLIAMTLLACTLLIESHSGTTGTTVVPKPDHVGAGVLSKQIATAASENTVPNALAPAPASVPSAPLHSPLLSDACVAAVASMTASPPCVVGDLRATRTMVLLGDSQALTWSSAFIDLGRSDHWKVVVLAVPGCPPWLTPNQSGASGVPCQQFHSYAARQIDALAPDLVVITGAPSATGTPAGDEAGLRRLLTSLSGHTTRSAVLGSIPWFDRAWTGPQPVECIVERPDSLATCNLPVVTLERSFGAFHAAIRRGATRAGAPFIPVASLFCTTTTCPVIVNHRIVYEGRYHLTSLFSSYIAPALSQQLRAALSLTIR